MELLEILGAFAVASAFILLLFRVFPRRRPEPDDEWMERPM